MVTFLAVAATKVVGDLILSNLVLGVTTGVTIWTAARKTSADSARRKKAQSK